MSHITPPTATLGFNLAPRPFRTDRSRAGRPAQGFWGEEHPTPAERGRAGRRPSPSRSGPGTRMSVGAWSDFFVAQLGASAALAGLLFVGLSVNLAKIVALPSLPSRAARALILLVGILMVSSLFLVPGQSVAALGAELLLPGAAIWVLVTLSSAASLRVTERQYLPIHAVEFGFVELAGALYVAAGLSLLTSHAVGIYLIVPAVLLSFVTAITDSWVLLVEVNR